MNVFKRFADIVSSNINSALDKMEDPKKMISLMIDQMEETAIDIRSSIAEKTAASTTLTRQLEETKAAVDRWAERARLAIGKGNEELAREAIKEKQALEAGMRQIETSISTLSSIIASLKDQLGQVETKLAEVKAKRDDLLARANAAKEKMKNNETIRAAESDDFSRRFEELQARIERWEAEAKICTAPQSSKTTRETFEEMEEEKAVEDELKAMKKEMGKEE